MNKSEWMQKIRKAEKIEKFSTIVELCRDKKVLDVGCIGQDHSPDSSGWLHGNLKKAAHSLVGTDINKIKIEALNQKGYEIYLPEDLKDDLKFDVVVMGDVIEHVNDPGAFLEFYSKFLKTDGQMIICTPNSFGIRYILHVLFYGRPTTNEEHTLSFDPYVMLELFERLKINPIKFYWLKEYRKSANFQQKVIFFISSFWIWMRKYYNSNFMYIVGKNA